MRNSTNKPNAKKGRGDSKGFTGLLHYFEVAVINSEWFQAMVGKLRKKYNIPEMGHKYDPKIPGLVGGSSWSDKKRISWGKDILKIRDTNALGSMVWDFIIADYLFYNRFDAQEHTRLYNYDLCKLDDLAEGYDAFTKDIEKAENTHFPIAIRISPYASITQIKDFIVKNQLSIKNQQKKHRVPDIVIGAVKGGKMSERNSLVMTMLREGIATKDVANKIPGITYADVNKIKYINKKRRKKL
jgi:hypothetical protein